jgi:type III secretory pathway component EscV
MLEGHRVRLACLKVNETHLIALNEFCGEITDGFGDFTIGDKKFYFVVQGENLAIQRLF